MTRVLFVCVRNAGLSQLAAALYEARGGEARSAGIEPAGEIEEAVIEALEEVGVDVGRRRPKGLTDAEVEWAELVVTLGCGDRCPALPGKQHLDWRVAEPVGLCLEEARELRSEIDRRVTSLP